MLLLLCSICKSLVLPKGHITANKIYFLNLCQFWAFCELQTRWIVKLLLITEFAYYIAKNTSTLHIIWAELLLLFMHFQIEDIITSALSTIKSHLFISFTYYCQSSIYQTGAGIQKYDINATKELRKRTLTI